MNVISLKLDKKEIELLKNTFKNELVENKPNYSLFQIKTENCVITAYTSLKVVFQGKDASVYASKFVKNNEFIEHVGNDEVGTGDYFGPVVVCSCMVLNKHLNIIKELKVQDSKSINDETIVKIGEKLIKILPFSLLILNNEKYNQISINNNLNEIKAKLHNKAFINLSKKHKLTDLKVIDQFTPEKNYYNYLKNEPLVVGGIHFETKAENKYLAVACASIIARYAFIMEFNKMCEKFNFNFLKGASDLVDKNIAEFVKKYGEDKLNLVAKLHFKNSEKYKKYL